MQKKASLSVQSHYFLNLKAFTILQRSTARFVSDLFGKPENRLSRDAASIKVGFEGLMYIHVHVGVLA